MRRKSWLKKNFHQEWQEKPSQEKNKESEMRLGKARVPDKKAAKVMTEGVAPKGKTQRLVATRNVDRFKKDGWKEAKSSVDKHNRTLGVNTNANDLVLMEK